MLATCLGYSSILKMEATCSSERLVDIQRTTRRYIITADVRTSTPAHEDYRLLVWGIVGCVRSFCVHFN
jgi:hypothetical protein